MDPLEALRPLHIPEPISWWPPAPGWWIIAVIVITTLILLYRRWHKLSPQRAALRELKTLAQNPQASCHPVALLNQLLKRYALVCWPTESVASLTGQTWLAFLDTHGGNGQFANGPGQILAHGPYQQNATDLQPLTQLARRWIKANRPK